MDNCITTISRLHQDGRLKFIVKKFLNQFTIYTDEELVITPFPDRFYVSANVKGHGKLEFDVTDLTFQNSGCKYSTSIFNKCWRAIIEANLNATEYLAYDKTRRAYRENMALETKRLFEGAPSEAE